MNPSFSEIKIIDVDQRHMLGRVHSFVNGSAVDGPGIRCVVFLQGCQLQCQYCHNRDSWDRNIGYLYSVDDVVEGALPYVQFMDASHGGVTVSGGEPLLQAEFVHCLFEKLHQLNVHTCLDTNGYAHSHLYGPLLESLLAQTDLVLLDIKHMDSVKHQALTGVDNQAVLAFARYLAEIKQPVWIRHVLVPGYTDSDQHIASLGQFLCTLPNVERVELLPFHRMGASKWNQLGLTFPLDHVSPPSSDSLQRIKSQLEAESGLTVLI